MHDKHLLEHIQDKIAMITLNRPDTQNGVTREILNNRYAKVDK